MHAPEVWAGRQSPLQGSGRSVWAGSGWPQESVALARVAPRSLAICIDMQRIRTHALCALQPQGATLSNGR